MKTQKRLLPLYSREKSEIEKTLRSIQTEVDASYLYKVLAEAETDPAVSALFMEMSKIESGHALAFLEKKGMDSSQLPSPSPRARILKKIGRLFGNDYLLGVLLDTEKSISNATIHSRKNSGLPSSISDTAHVTIVHNLMKSGGRFQGAHLARFEKRHRSVGGNALRAAVLGGNDGLVSNFSLVMGVAGATSGREEILLAGVAGLLAGALSMALGEWISVKSSQELYENQMALEMEELETNPEGEKQELVLIYKSKGIPEEQAKKMAEEVFSDKSHAHEILVKEELGINSEELEGSAMQAAVSSFVLFALGAILPLLPFFFLKGTTAIVISALASAIGLFGIGAAITLFTGKSIWVSGFRQVIFGLAAAAVTFGIGKLIGISIAG